jgi:hypothetical protein
MQFTFLYLIPFSILACHLQLDLIRGVSPAFFYSGFIFNCRFLIFYLIILTLFNHALNNLYSVKLVNNAVERIWRETVKAGMFPFPINRFNYRTKEYVLIATNSLCPVFRPHRTAS